MNLLMISGDRSMATGKRGAFWYTLELLSTHFDRIDVICPHVKVEEMLSTHPDKLTFFGNVYIHPNPKGLFSQSSWILKKGSQLYGLFRHNVMTVHEYPPFYNGIGARKLIKKVKDIGSVLEVHHIVGYPNPANLTEKMGKWMSRVYLPKEAKKFTAVRLVSKRMADLLMSWGVSKHKVAVVPSFYLDHAAFRSLAPAVKKYDVAFCARLVANKGLDRVLHAIAKIPRATLLIVGDGPDRAKCEALCKQLDIRERVEFRGWLSTQEEVLRTIATAKIFVMNSLSEGGPRIALEAMGAGLPVIATRVGVMEDVIEEGKNGLLTTGEPDDLAQKITMLLSNPQLREQIGLSARSILDRFERGRLIAHYAKFLQECAHTDDTPSRA